MNREENEKYEKIKRKMLEEKKESEEFEKLYNKAYKEVYGNPNKKTYKIILYIAIATIIMEMINKYILQ